MAGLVSSPQITSLGGPAGAPTRSQRKIDSAASSGVSSPPPGGGGRALYPSERADFEPRFGADLSGVRLHTDASADRASTSLGARAFTSGQDIFFKQCAYQLGTGPGRMLLSHELVHVIQQRGGSSAVQRWAEDGSTISGDASGVIRRELEATPGFGSSLADLGGQALESALAFGGETLAAGGKPVGQSLDLARGGFRSVVDYFAVERNELKGAEFIPAHQQRRGR